MDNWEEVKTEDLEPGDIWVWREGGMQYLLYSIEAYGPRHVRIIYVNEGFEEYDMVVPIGRVALRS